MTHRLQSRRLYIADLARHQHDMETGALPMQALTYRVLSRCLREALAGLPEPVARAGFPELPAHLMPAVAEMLETRHFDHHGRLFGLRAAHCLEVADALVARLQSRPLH